MAWLKVKSDLAVKKAKAEKDEEVARRYQREYMRVDHFVVAFQMLWLSECVICWAYWGYEPLSLPRERAADNQAYFLPYLTFC